MYAANALADRIVCAAKEQRRFAISAKGGEIPQGFLVHHDAMFRSVSSDIDGQLTLELARYLRMMKGRVCHDASIVFVCESAHYWDEAQCFLRVRCHEVYGLKEEADRRQREIIEVFGPRWVSAVALASQRHHVGQYMFSPLDTEGASILA